MDPVRSPLTQHPSTLHYAAPPLPLPPSLDPPPLMYSTTPPKQEHLISFTAHLSLYNSKSKPESLISANRYPRPSILKWFISLIHINANPTLEFLDPTANNRSNLCSNFWLHLKKTQSMLAAIMMNKVAVAARAEVQYD